MGSGGRLMTTVAATSRRRRLRWPCDDGGYGDLATTTAATAVRRRRQRRGLCDGGAAFRWCDYVIAFAPVSIGIIYYKRDLKDNIHEYKSYKGIFGVASSSRTWKWYKFVRKNISKSHKPKTSWGNRSYIPSDEEEEEVFEIAYKSKILDIIDKKSFDHLVKEMKEHFSKLNY
ncbi:hypothetical protein BU17DRAFT_62981 [Hysterangium stoloniferum]|nr:hypothetical protein BU17DRAFT_62981 [Hysterangium stoloniferum]